MLCVGGGAATIGCDLNLKGPKQSVILGSDELPALSTLRRAPFIQLSQLVITEVPLFLRWGGPLCYIHVLCHGHGGGILGEWASTQWIKWAGEGLYLSDCGGCGGLYILV